MIEDRQNRAGDEPHRLGALRQRGEKNDRGRAVSAVPLEIVLDRPRVGEAEALGLLCNRQRFREIGRGTFLVRTDARKELHAELHSKPSAQGSATVALGTQSRSSLDVRGAAARMP